MVESGANALEVVAASVALTWSGCANAALPLTSRPVAVALGVADLRAAAVALEMTDAATEAS